MVKNNRQKKDRILQINRVDSSVLRNTSTRVLFPVDFVEVRDDKLKYVTEEIAVEPCSDSPFKWDVATAFYNSCRKNTKPFIRTSLP